jgi:hypothetical protein
MSMSDPRKTLSVSNMSVAQIAAVAITIGLNAIDGFDVLAISFASPGIAREWGIDRAALGIVLSMELIGMGLGSILLGGVADKIGRRRTLLGCLVVMTLGMVMATRAKGVYDLSVWRVFTGLGIGGMLASINAVAAEFSSDKRRSLNVSLMAIGYPIGADRSPRSCSSKVNGESYSNSAQSSRPCSSPWCCGWCLNPSLGYASGNPRARSTASIAAWCAWGTGRSRHCRRCLPKHARVRWRTSSVRS